ncbi:MAG: hypothetical protein DWQ01_00350 [Planctomycetota bacterium]|nr:MAG: hypothetical protein DWQ01_00350 [Planctomycetota bacterium]
MTIIGLLVRVDPDKREQAQGRLDALPWAQASHLKDDQVCVVLEAEDLDQAYRRLRGEVETLDGVLAAWPVYVNLEEEDDAHPDGSGVAS